jgi:ribonuclease P protein subunit POP4
MIKEKNYEITKDNLLNHELIGLKVEVINSLDKNKIGINGMVIDETKNTLIVLVKNEKKVLPKNECDFLFDIGEKVVLNGKKILKRPEERLKIR